MRYSKKQSPTPTTEAHDEVPEVTKDNQAELLWLIWQRTLQAHLSVLADPSRCNAASLESARRFLQSNHIELSPAMARHPAQALAALQGATIGVPAVNLGQLPTYAPDEYSTPEEVAAWNEKQVKAGGKPYVRAARAFEGHISGDNDE